MNSDVLAASEGLESLLRPALALVRAAKGREAFRGELVLMEA